MGCECDPRCCMEMLFRAWRPLARKPMNGLGFVATVFVHGLFMFLNIEPIFLLV
jgi:hypothetical protein